MSDEKVVKFGGRKKKKKYLPFLYAAFALIIVGIFMYQVYKINYSPVKTEIALEKTVSNYPLINPLRIFSSSLFGM